MFSQIAETHTPNFGALVTQKSALRILGAGKRFSIFEVSGDCAG